MSLAEDLLNSLPEDQPAVASADPATEPHIVINADKTVIVPESLQRILVQHDHNIETVTFDCPRYWDGHDLSQMSLRIVFQRSDGHKEPHPVENLRVDESDDRVIHFDWTISGNTTFTSGNVKITVCAKRTNAEGVSEREWHTIPNQDLFVNEGMDCSGEEIVERNPDVIEYILARLDTLESTGGATNPAYTLPIGGAELGGVKNGGNVTINPDGTMDAPEAKLTDEQAATAIAGYLQKNPIDVIEQPTIYPMPKQCAAPELVWSGLIQDDLSINRAKPSMMVGNGNRWVIVWGENLDGNTADLPTYTGTGTLAIKYRACWANGGTLDSVLSDGIGTVAQMGDNYIDYTGATKALPGGCGLPSSVGVSGTVGKAYFSSVESGTTTINGTRQRLIPCCVDVTIGDANAVAFATPRELTLDINGEVGAFDMSRLGYDNWYTYYTTMAPTYYNGTYSWCQPVTDGFVYLTSTDGINWVYVCKVSTPIQPRYEVGHAFRFGQWSSRTVAVVRTAEHCLLVLLFDNSSGKVYRQYKVDDVGSRPMIYTGRNYATLLHTINTDRNQMEILQLKPNDADDITFYRWATIYEKATWYPTIANNPHYLATDMSELKILGNNLGVASGKGMSMVKLQLDTTKPKSVTDCVLDDPSASSAGVIPVASPETLGGVKPVAQKDGMEKEVGVDADGRLYATTELTTPKIQSLCALLEKLSTGGNTDAELAAFKNEWAASATLIGISATYTGGSVAVGTALTNLTGVTVSAEFSDGSTKAVTDYTLSGTIAVGSNTITATYGGFTATFSVVGVEESTDEPILTVNSADMSLMSDTTYDDGVFTINADRSWVAYNTGFLKHDVCLFSEVDGKNVTISFDWAIDPEYENVGGILVNLNANVDGNPKRWMQGTVAGVAIGKSGNYSNTFTISASLLTVGSGDILPTDYFGCKVMYTFGKATISNFKIEIR